LGSTVDQVLGDVAKKVSVSLVANLDDTGVRDLLVWLVVMVRLVVVVWVVVRVGHRRGVVTTDGRTWEVVSGSAMKCQKK
jgi:hypothetical protein